MIAEKVQEMIEQRTGGVYKPSAFRASEAGHMCARYHYHCRADWDKRPAPSPKLAAIFALGQELESYVLRQLAEVGVRVVKTQVSAEDRDLELIGHVDGFIENGTESIPIEVKSVNQFDWQAINSWSDLVTERSPYLIRWALQLPLYMYLHGCNTGLYLLINKQSGQLKELAVGIEEAWPLLEQAEKHLRKAQAALKAGVPPEPEPWSKALCRFCWAKEVGLCPGASSEVSVEVTEDLEEAVRTMVETREAHRRYEQAQKVVSKHFESFNAPGEKAELFVGAVPVRVSLYETTRYEVPPEVKKQYARKVLQRRVEVLG